MSLFRPPQVMYRHVFGGQIFESQPLANLSLEKETIHSNCMPKLIGQWLQLAARRHHRELCYLLRYLGWFTRGRAEIPSHVRIVLS